MIENTANYMRVKAMEFALDKLENKNLLVYIYDAAGKGHFSLEAKSVSTNSAQFLTELGYRVIRKADVTAILW